MSDGEDLYGRTIRAHTGTKGRRSIARSIWVRWFPYDKKTQAASVVPSAEGKPRGTVLTDREYLEQSRFGVILSGAESLLKEIEAYMQNPRWGVWLGRKSCIPADLIYRGLHAAETEAEASLIKAAKGRVLRRIREVQDFAAGTDTLMDRPLDFKKRDFTPRRVKIE